MWRSLVVVSSQHIITVEPRSEALEIYIGQIKSRYGKETVGIEKESWISNNF